MFFAAPDAASVTVLSSGLHEIAGWWGPFRHIGEDIAAPNKHSNALTGRRTLQGFQKRLAPTFVGRLWANRKSNPLDQYLI
jgi:hypothetical protein